MIYNSWKDDYEKFSVLQVLREDELMKMVRKDSGTSFGLVVNHIGQYTIVGDPTDFYVYLIKPPEGFQPWSGRIYDINVYHEMKRALNGPMEEFKDKCTALFDKHKKSWKQS